MYKIIIEKNVSKFLEKHKGEKIITLFREKILELAKNPYENSLDIKILIGYKNKFRLRIGKYRFLYEIDDKVICIKFFAADSRGSIY